MPRSISSPSDEFRKEMIEEQNRRNQEQIRTQREQQERTARDIDERVKRFTEYPKR